MVHGVSMIDAGQHVAADGLVRSTEHGVAWHQVNLKMAGSE